MCRIAMRKTLLILLLIFSLTLSFVACDKKPEPTEPTVPTEPEETFEKTGKNAGLTDSGYFVNFEKYESQYDIESKLPKHLSMEEALQLLYRYERTNMNYDEWFASEEIAAFYPYSDTELDYQDIREYGIIKWVEDNTDAMIQQVGQYVPEVDNRTSLIEYLTNRIVFDVSNREHIMLQLFRESIDSVPEEYVEYTRQYLLAEFEEEKEHHEDAKTLDDYLHHFFDNVDEKTYVEDAAKARFAVMLFAKKNNLDPMYDFYTQKDIDEHRKEGDLPTYSYYVLRDTIFYQIFPLEDLLGVEQ